MGKWHITLQEFPWAGGIEVPIEKKSGNILMYKYKGNEYSVELKSGRFEKETRSGLKIIPRKGKVVVGLGR